MDKQKLGGEKTSLQRSKARLSLVQGLVSKTYPYNILPPLNFFLLRSAVLLCTPQMAGGVT